MMTLFTQRDVRDRLDTSQNALAPTSTTPSDFGLQKVAAGTTGVDTLFTGPLCSDQRNIIVSASIPWTQSLDQETGSMITVEPGEKVRFAMKSGLNVSNMLKSASNGPPGGINVQAHFCNPGGGGCGGDNPTFADRQKYATGDPTTSTPVVGSVEIVMADAIFLEAPTKIDHPGKFNLAMEYITAGPCGVYEWGYGIKCSEVGVGHWNCNGADSCWSKTSFKVCSGGDPPPTTVPTAVPTAAIPPTTAPVPPTESPVSPVPVVTVVRDENGTGYNLRIDIADSLTLTQTAWSTFERCAGTRQISVYFGDKQYQVASVDWSSKQFSFAAGPTMHENFRGVYASDNCSFFIQ